MIDFELIFKLRNENYVHKRDKHFRVTINLTGFKFALFRSFNAVFVGRGVIKD